MFKNNNARFLRKNRASLSFMTSVYSIAFFYVHSGLDEFHRTVNAENAAVNSQIITL